MVISLSKEDQEKVIKLFYMLNHPAYSDFKSSLFSSPPGIAFFSDAHYLLGKMKNTIEE